MSSLALTVATSLLSEPVDLRLPGDVALERLLPLLVEALGLPPGAYQLWYGDRRLAMDEILLDAGVLRGDVLVLRREVPEDGPPLEVLAAPVRPAGGAPVGSSVSLADLVPSQVGRREPRSGRVLAFWSGPAGGTGRTTLALSLALFAAERGISGAGSTTRDVVLLALSEPALCTYLLISRVPNANAFFDTGSLEAAEQVVSWGAPGRGGVLRVLLGPARPREEGVGGEDVGALVDAARAEHDLVVVDLPPLTPGRDVWVTQPLLRSDQLVLVASPGVTGVVATVEALGVYYDLGAEMRVQVALNRRAPGGLSLHDFVAGVGDIWGFCPPVIEIPFLSILPDLLDRGEMPPVIAPASGEALIGANREERRWVAALEHLVVSVFEGQD